MNAHVKLLALYFLALIIGVLVLPAYIDFPTTASTGQTTVHADAYLLAPPAVQNEDWSFVFIIVSVIIGTALVLLLIKFGKLLFMRIWLWLSFTVALTVAFYPFISHIAGFILPVLCAIILSTLALSGSRTASTIVQLFVYAGIAALFVPILNLLAATIMIIIIAMYDIYMVYGSKMMVTLAKSQLQNKAFAGLSVGSGYVHEERIVEHKGKAVAKSTFAAVGGGDIAFALLFAGALMKYVGAVWP
jgi:presenilin-like A22 family membrane protease